MKLNEYREIIEKYKKEYELKLEKNKKEYIECMHNYNKESFINIMLNHQKIIKELIFEIISEFDEFKNNDCCIMINGSLARGTNTLYSDIDINYFYNNEKFDSMINIEESVNYILQSIMNYRGKDRIHSMVVYLPLIRNNNYEPIKNNKYPIYFEDGIIYNSCRENAEKLMYETYNSTRDINDLVNYLNSNDNDKKLNEWANCFELIYDNNLYEEFVNKRKICKDKNNIQNLIINVLTSIKKDNNYIENTNKEIKIKELKLFYKMLVLDNAYKVLSIYFRLNKEIQTINIKEFERRNIGLPEEFYDSFYKYLNLIQKLQFILDKKNMDLSFHSNKSILKNDLNDIYMNSFNKSCIINDLNNMKYEFYEICKNVLEKEVKKNEEFRNT